MEKTIHELQKNIESKDWDTVLDIINTLQKEDRTEAIPIEWLVGIIKNPSAHTRVKTAAADTLIVRSTKRDQEALQGAVECLDCYQNIDACVDMMAAIALNPDGKELIKILPQGVLSNLTQAGEIRVRKLILMVFLKIAEEDPSHIPMTILLEAMLTENENDIREQILKIAEVVNPVDKLKEFQIVDTLFLMNWIRKKRNICENQTRNIIDNLNGIVSGSEPSELANALISLGRAVDLLLFLIPKRYRGHDVHTLNVATLGFFLLDVYVSDSQTLKEYVAQQKHWRKEQVEKAWLIAALLHDHALPISFMLKIAPSIHMIKKTRSSYSEPIEKFIALLKSTYGDLCSNELREIHDMLLKGECAKGLSSLSHLISTELQRINCYDEVEKYEIIDHGILSAINLTTKLGVFNKDWGVDIEVIQAAAKAIAVHTLPLTVDLKKDPISFLLVLCDELQEWGREMVVFPEIVIETPSIQIGRFVKKEKGKKLLFPDVLEISFVFPSREKSEKTDFNGKVFTDKKMLLKDRLVFDPRINPHGISYDFLSKA